MSVKYINDWEYASEKLCGSDVFYNGEFCYVKNIDPDEIVTLWSYVTEKYLKIPLSDLDLEPPKLGYVNLDYESSYISRVPKKYWKQGQNKNTILAGSKHVGNNHYQKILLNFSKPFPSLEQCVEVVYNEEAISRAFHRNFCVMGLDDNQHLFYKNYRVGLVNPKNLDLQLSGKALVLKEVLEECLS